MKIGILGAGTWGTALSAVLGAKHDVVLWSAIGEEIDALALTRRHVKLPDFLLPDSVLPTRDIEQACVDAPVLLVAVPSVYVRATVAAARAYITPGTIIVCVAKGIESDTLLTMTEIIEEELAGLQIRTVALSGPTHAEEVAKGIPSSIVSASDDPMAAAAVQQLFLHSCMRVYTNADIRGVELCGAMKNIVALASGISGGLGYGDNTRAAIITRGMAEIARLGLAMGCAEQTFYGLAGIGDLIVTATSLHSRNYRAGQLIGSGMKTEEAVGSIGMTVEGINALPAAMQLSRKYGVEMPIIASVDAVVFGRMTPTEAVDALMERKMKAETITVVAR